MSNKNIVKSHIEDTFRTNKLAVLATEGNGQPHACFIAITPMDDFIHLIFATYRNTRKYSNLMNNNKEPGYIDTIVGAGLNVKFSAP